MNIRKLKLFLPTLAGILLFIFLVPSLNVPAFADEESPKGSIRVCKIVIDSNNAIVDASQAPGTTFSISGLNTTTSQGGPTGVLGTSIFSTPLTINSKALGSSETNDASCTKYSNLDLGNYYYGQESIGSGNWAAPKYTDQFTVSANTISDFYNYDNKLFDADLTNDGERNTNADGHIVLEANNPNRTLIVLNQLQATSISIGGANVGGGSSSAPSCSVNGPQKVDQVWFSDKTATSVMVHWANKGDASGYHIQYGPSANNLPWGTEVAGNVNFVTLNNLPGGDLWVTVTAKQSAECGGVTTDPIKVTAAIGGGQVLGVSTGPQVLAATGSSDVLAIASLGFGMIGAGIWQLKRVKGLGSR